MGNESVTWSPVGHTSDWATEVVYLDYFSFHLEFKERTTEKKREKKKTKNTKEVWNKCLKF